MGGAGADRAVHDVLAEMLEVGVAQVLAARLAALQPGGDRLAGGHLVAEGGERRPGRQQSHPL